MYKIVWSSTYSKETCGSVRDRLCIQNWKYICLFFFSIIFQSFGEGVLQSMKSLLHSRKELCSISADECVNREEQDHFIEVWLNITIYICVLVMLESYLACSRMGIANVSNIATYWLLTLYPQIVILEFSHCSLENNCDISRWHFSAL